MSISIECSRCHKKLKAPDELAGTRANCPGCGQAIAVIATLKVRSQLISEHVNPVKPKGTTSKTLADKQIPSSDAANNQAAENERTLTKARTPKPTDMPSPKRTWSWNNHPVWQIIGGIAWILLTFLIASLGGGPLAAVFGVAYGGYNVFRGSKELKNRKLYDAMEVDRRAIHKGLQRDW